MIIPVPVTETRWRYLFIYLNQSVPIRTESQHSTELTFIMSVSPDPPRDRQPVGQHGQAPQLPFPEAGATQIRLYSALGRSLGAGEGD